MTPVCALEAADVVDVDSGDAKENETKEASESMRARSPLKYSSMSSGTFLRLL